MRSGAEGIFKDMAETFQKPMKDSKPQILEAQQDLLNKQNRHANTTYMFRYIIIN